MAKRFQTKGVSVFLTAALLLGGCGSATETAETDSVSAIAIKAAEAQVGALTISNEFIGTATPQQQVSIIPLVSGEVDAVYFEVGDEVEAGDILFHIKDDAAKLQQESAQLQKQSAEISAQMQLGSAQVMSNISMQSNIRSIEFQIDQAKSQLNQTVDGIADAEEAKEQMQESLDSINSNIASLQSSQKEMEKTIEEAKEYIHLGVNGYEWDEAYPSDWEAPDNYDWSGQGGNGGNGTDPSEPTPSQNAPQPEGGASAGDGQADDSEAGNGETQPNDSGTGNEDESGTGTGDTTPGTETDDTQQGESGTETASEVQQESGETDAPGTASDAAPTDESRDSVGAAPTGGNSNSSENRTETESGDSAAAGRDYAYFSVELVREAEPIYLAEGKPAPPDDRFSSEAEAQEAYKKQQKINSLKKKTEAMGFSAKDIKTGAADAAMLENAAQIVMLEYQASQIKSNQGTVDSSISSAETARDTTEKTIDFYEDNLKDAQTTYGIQNGQAYQDTASALATQIQAADIGVKSAELQLEYYSPAAPISGTVISKNVEVYGMTQAGYAAYVISNQDAMNVSFSVSSKVRDNLAVGMPVTLERDGETWQGTITEIGEAVDAQSGGLFTIKAVTEVSGDKLPGGSAVKLTVDTFRSENAVLIPYDAVHFESEQAYVYVIKDGKAVRTAISVGLMNDDTVEVTEGLSAGDRIVSTWSAQLEDGIDVRVIGEDGE